MKVKFIFILFLIILVSLSCNEDNNPTLSDEEREIPVSSDMLVHAELLSVVSVYKQSHMLTKYEDELYKFGTSLPLQIYNLNTNTWREEEIQDNSYARWDGAAVTINESIYIISSISTTLGIFDFLKFDPKNNQYTHTDVKSPIGFNYPAYCSLDDQIYFLSMETDSVYKYDTKNNLLTAIVENPFHSEVNYWNLSSGIFENNFYVFGSLRYSEFPNIFYLLNLSDYTWEEIEIPSIIENQFLFGSVLENQMLLFSDSSDTYLYDLNDNNWVADTSHSLINSGEWSFCSDNSTLYASEVWSKELWKISIDHKK